MSNYYQKIGEQKDELKNIYANIQHLSPADYSAFLSDFFWNQKGFFMDSAYTRPIFIKPHSLIINGEPYRKWGKPIYTPFYTKLGNEKTPIQLTDPQTIIFPTDGSAYRAYYADTNGIEYLIKWNASDHKIEIYEDNILKEKLDSLNSFIILDIQAPGGAGGKGSSVQTTDLVYFYGGGGGGGGAFARLLIDLIDWDNYCVVIKYPPRSNIGNQTTVTITCEHTSTTVWDPKEKVELHLKSGKLGSSLGPGGEGGTGEALYWEDDYQFTMQLNESNQSNAHAQKIGSYFYVLTYNSGSKGGNGGILVYEVSSSANIIDNQNPTRGEDNTTFLYFGDSFCQKKEQAGGSYKSNTNNSAQGGGGGASTLGQGMISGIEGVVGARGGGSGGASIDYTSNSTNYILSGPGGFNLWYAKSN